MPPGCCTGAAVSELPAPGRRSVRPKRRAWLTLPVRCSPASRRRREPRSQQESYSQEPLRAAPTPEVRRQKPQLRQTKKPIPSGSFSLVSQSQTFGGPDYYVPWGCSPPATGAELYAFGGSGEGPSLPRFRSTGFEAPVSAGGHFGSTRPRAGQLVAYVRPACFRPTCHPETAGVTLGSAPRQRSKAGLASSIGTRGSPSGAAPSEASTVGARLVPMAAAPGDATDETLMVRYQRAIGKRSPLWCGAITSPLQLRAPPTPQARARRRRDPGGVSPGRSERERIQARSPVLDLGLHHREKSLYRPPAQGGPPAPSVARPTSLGPGEDARPLGDAISDGTRARAPSAPPCRRR